MSEKTGAGQLCFNGGGEFNFMGLPNFSARVVEQNINAANDNFLGGKSNKKNSELLLLSFGSKISVKSHMASCH